jgi:hypothetical protein
MMLLIINIVRRYFLFVVIVLFAIIAIFGIWQTQYIAFDDYPSHLFRAHVLLNYNNPACEYYHNCFVINWGLTPNEGSDFIIFLLGKFFPLEIATKIFFTLYIILLPLGLFYFLKCVNPENISYAIVASILTFNTFLVTGNLNFIISIPLFFLFLGYWYKNKNQYSLKNTIINTLLLLSVYYSHIISFGCALIVILVISIKEKIVKESLLNTSLGFSLGLSIFLICILNSRKFGKEMPDSIVPFFSFRDKLNDILLGVNPAFINTYSPTLFISIILLMTILGIFNKENNKYRSWHLVILTFLFLIFLLPRFIMYASGSAITGQRIALLTLFLATAVFSNKKIIKYAFLSFIIILTMFLRMEEVRYLGSTDKMIDYFISPFRRIPQYLRNKEIVVLPLVLYPYTYYPFAHRSFEYYNIINGGFNTYHLMSPLFTVRYANKLPRIDIYEPFPEKLTKEILEFYDVVIIIGKDGYRGRELIEYIVKFGFKEVSGNEITGVFSKI